MCGRNKLVQKITLISPSQAAIDPGLRGISSFLKVNGYDTTMIFLQKRFEKTLNNSLIKQIAEICEGSSSIGITLMTHEFYLCCELTKELKKLTKIPIIWGGVHPTIRPEECLEHCDSVCRGEGEYYFKKEWDGNINRLPFPDYSFKNHYYLRNNRLQKIFEPQEVMGSAYFLYSQRGCPFGCSYCINGYYHKHGYMPHRKRHILLIMDELHQITQQFSFIKEICFDSDDFLSMNKYEFQHFLGLYGRIGLPFHINTTPQNVTEERIEELIKLGLKSVAMGIQSGSGKTLALYKRRTFQHQILNATQILNKYSNAIGKPNYDIMLDNPWETQEDKIETLRLLDKVPQPYNLMFYSLTLYPETELYQKAKQEGMIKDEVKEVYLKSHALDIKNTYFNNLIFLYSIWKFPLWLLRSQLFRFSVIHSYYFLRLLYSMRFLVAMVKQRNMGLLRNYIKVGIRELKRLKE